MLVLGAFIALASFALFCISTFRARGWASIIDALLYRWPIRQLWFDWNYGFNDEYRYSCYGGAGLTLVGWLLSYGYEATLGRFINWVRTGRT
jgi:hypothetical protein